MRAAPLYFVVSAALLLTGCDSEPESFPPNRVHALVVEASRRVPTNVAADESTRLVDSWFGTPLEPRWPVEHLEGSAAKDLVDLENLKRASGRVFSDQDDRHFGLYREHCVTCHGISGGGDGPASLLQNPYPRDFRAGVFKWKSTVRGSKPTRADLRALLEHGAPGSAMPSFQAIDDEDIDALVDYVIFLSVRGEFERRIVYEAVDNLDYDDTEPEAELSFATAVSFTEIRSESDGNEAYWVARDALNRITDGWAEAEDKVVEVPAEPPRTDEGLRIGKEIFHGQIANCAGCHGKGGEGGMRIVDFDDWTKEFTTRLSITPSDPEAVKPFRAAGALRPREIHPRRLIGGVYRGGGEGETLYRRLTQGIAGSPMPGLILTDEATPTSLSPDQLWNLVHYVQSLPEGG